VKHADAGFIDVDQHLVESPTLFTEWGASAFQDQFPKYLWQGVVQDGGLKGCPGWQWDDRFYAMSAGAVAGGKPWGQAGIFVPVDEVPPGLWDPAERIKAMDQDGVACALLYPSFMGLGGETPSRHKDKAVSMAVVEAYNRWLFQEWLAYAPTRFLPAVALPLWDVGTAARLARLAALDGAVGILFPQDQRRLGLPPVWDPYWKDLWHACEANNLVVCQHTLSDDTDAYMNTGGPPYLPLTLARMSAVRTVAEWILTPALDNHPNLRIMVAEGGVGWIPHFLSLADQSSRLHAGEFGKMKMRPSERMDLHFGLSILGSDETTAGMFEALPSGLQRKLMFETDYCHADGSFPNSRAAFEGLDLPDYLRAGVVRQNAIDFFRLSEPYNMAKAKAAADAAEEAKWVDLKDGGVIREGEFIRMQMRDDGDGLRGHAQVYRP